MKTSLVRILAGLALLALLRWTMPLALPLACTLLWVLLFSASTEWLQSRGVPAPLAAGLPVFLPVAAGVGAALRFAPATFTALHTATAAIGRMAQPVAARPDLVGAAARWTLDRLAWSDAALAARLGDAMLPAVLGVTVVSMLTFFLLLGQRSLVAALVAAQPRRRQRLALIVGLHRARRGVARWLGTSAVVNLGLGIATGAALALLDLPSAVGWAGVTTALLFIPYGGPLLITLLLAAAGSSASIGALWPPLVFLLLHAVEANFISPWLMGRRLSVSRSMLLLSVQVGAFAWGVGGAVLAVPLLIVVHAALRVRPGRPVAKALFGAEDDAARSLQDTARDVLRVAHPTRAGSEERRIHVVGRGGRPPPAP